jgi:hypothetical protein
MDEAYLYLLQSVFNVAPRTINHVSCYPKNYLKEKQHNSYFCVLVFVEDITSSPSLLILFFSCA